jgi:hypothetical protein
MDLETGMTVRFPRVGIRLFKDGHLRINVLLITRAQSTNGHVLQESQWQVGREMLSIQVPKGFDGGTCRLDNLFSTTGMIGHKVGHVVNNASIRHVDWFIVGTIVIGQFICGIFRQIVHGMTFDYGLKAFRGYMSRIQNARR